MLERSNVVLLQAVQAMREVWAVRYWRSTADVDVVSELGALITCKSAPTSPISFHLAFFDRHPPPMPTIRNVLVDITNTSRASNSVRRARSFSSCLCVATLQFDKCQGMPDKPQRPQALTVSRQQDHDGNETDPAFLAMLGDQEQEPVLCCPVS